MTDHVEVRRGHYADSVALMQVSAAVTAVEGVEAGLVAMATELNVALLGDLGFAVPSAGPDDLVVAVRAHDAAALDAALAALASALAARPAASSADAGEAAPRTVGDAVARGADLALVSTPGDHAFVEALDAVEAGVHVMVFSDNVTVAQEVALKRRADERGVLVMGPDAGTAIVGGVGLGFANVVRPGPVGVVAASGTGAQQLACLLDLAGVGVSHVLGVGGRDLSAAVGGRSTLRALRMLDEDPATERIVLLSKPPDPEVARRVEEVVATLRTPLATALLGEGRPDLTAVAADVAAAAGGSVPDPWPSWGERPVPSAPGRLVGLFAGGTLCAEAVLIARAALGDVHANVVVPAPLRVGGATPVAGHLLLDLGEDEFTRGRPHPMIDGRLRADRIVAEAPTARVLLLDVVLGHAAHPDPAAELAPLVARVRDDAATAGRELDVVVSLCGGRGDPQGLERQATALAAAGAHVTVSNAEAARLAVALAGGAR